jgi:hypothetical protein
MPNDHEISRPKAPRLALLCVSFALLSGRIHAEKEPHHAVPRAEKLTPLEGRDERTGLGDSAHEEAAASASAEAAERDDRVERRLRGRKGYLRSESRAYLSLPEWYVVYRADEFAAFIQNERPSHFPYFAGIAQLWRIYYHVLGATWRTSPWSRQLMIGVIGSSCTIEYLFEGLYENVIGRLTELTLPRGPWQPATVEDRYIRQVARDYAIFLHTRQWYEFPFAAKLSSLWALHGPLDWTLLRRLDRRFAFTVELAVKAAWAGLIRKGSEWIHDPEDRLIQAWVRRAPAASDPGIAAREELDRSSELLLLPRYDAFTAVVSSLARQGVRFVRVSGNDEILMTLIATTSWMDTRYRGLVLVEWPILTEPGKKRVAMTVSVERLNVVIPSLTAERVRIDHIYDF